MTITDLMRRRSLRSLRNLVDFLVDGLLHLPVDQVIEKLPELLKHVAQRRLGAGDLLHLFVH